MTAFSRRCRDAAARSPSRTTSEVRLTGAPSVVVVMMSNSRCTLPSAPRTYRGVVGTRTSMAVVASPSSPVVVGVTPPGAAPPSSSSSPHAATMVTSDAARTAAATRRPDEIRMPTPTDGALQSVWIINHRCSAQRPGPVDDVGRVLAVCATAIRPHLGALADDCRQAAHPDRAEPADSRSVHRSATTGRAPLLARHHEHPVRPRSVAPHDRGGRLSGSVGRRVGPPED